jgi:hypothetical protein
MKIGVPKQIRIEEHRAGCVPAGMRELAEGALKLLAPMSKVASRMPSHCIAESTCSFSEEKEPKRLLCLACINGKIMRPCGARHKSFFASFFSKKEDSFFLAVAR